MLQTPRQLIAERDPARAPFAGRYDLERELGRGSTGTVWQARDRHTSEIVAVKVIQPHLLALPSAEQRFLREVASARSLVHPHTVRVRAHGWTLEGTGYLVMERLRGVTLAARLSESGPLQQRRAIKIVAQILDAAGAAHRLQIVHRDLKPSNVMLVERDGDPDFVKVCDFGLAKAIDVEGAASEPCHEGVLAEIATATEVGEICGTPAYMAPEQARGEELDGRVDLYAVGVMLFEALVGKVPFSGRSTLAVVSQHLSAVPPRPSAVRPDLGIFPPLESLLLRALAKNRAERPSSAEVFRADLLQIDRDLARELRPARKPRDTPRQRSSADGATLPRGVNDNADGRVPRAFPRRARLVLGGGTLALVLVAMGWLGWRASVTLPSGSESGPTTTTIAASTGNVALGPPPATGSPRTMAAESPPAPQMRAVARGLPPRTGRTARAATPSPRSNARSEAIGTSGRAPPTAARRVRTSSPAPAPVQEGPAIDPADAEPLVARAEGLLGRGHIVESCTLGREASRLYPSDARTWEFLGRCLMRLGQPDQARVAYRRYLAIAPDGPDAIFVRAMVDREQP